ncbi:MAG: hypothetical protein PHW04_03845 [Candidatus Wallbacteria bacterium]|nr:hypothetical protein [Candidatus Wallbacteria bacterium]
MKKAAHLICSLLLLFFCTSGSAAEADPGQAMERGQGKIVFTTYFTIGENCFNICTVNEDGSCLTRLHKVGDEGTPSISPDGTKIIYMCSKENDWTESDIYQMNMDGSDVQRLTELHDWTISYPRYFPDGKKLVFGRRVACNYDLYTLDLSCGSIQRITQTGEEIREMCAIPSPDGKKLLCSAYLLYENINTLFLMNADGSDCRRIVPEGSDAIGMSFSPDGKKIAYCMDNPHPKQIELLDLSTGVTSEVVRIKDSTNYGETSFTRDGRRLIINACDDAFPSLPAAAGGGSQLFSVSLDGKDVKRITTDTYEKLWPMAF